MIIVRVELHSARTGVITELARMKITNEGVSTSGRRGNYAGWTYVGRSKGALDQERVSKIGAVNNHARLDLHIWNLVAKMLLNMGYTK